jgi:hypothetical protein
MIFVYQERSFISYLCFSPKKEIQSFSHAADRESILECLKKITHTLAQNNQDNLQSHLQEITHLTQEIETYFSGLDQFFDALKPFLQHKTK